MFSAHLVTNVSIFIKCLRKTDGLLKIRYMHIYKKNVKKVHMLTSVLQCFDPTGKKSPIARHDMNFLDNELYSLLSGKIYK